MTYNEEMLDLTKRQLVLAEEGLKAIAKTFIEKDICNFTGALEPYLTAVKQLKSIVEYYKKAVEKEKAEDNG